MNTSRQHHALTLGHVLNVLLACNGKDLEGIAGQCLTKTLTSGELSLDGIRHYLIQVFGQVSVGVRIAVSEVHGVISVLKVVRERVGVVGTEDATRLLLVLADAVLIVANLRSCSMPTDILEGSHLFRVDKDLHALIIKTVRLAQIEHVEPDLDGLVVLRSEEVPLSVTTCVDIVLEEQVVLVVVDSGCCSKVS